MANRPEIFRLHIKKNRHVRLAMGEEMFNAKSAKEVYVAQENLPVPDVAGVVIVRTTHTPENTTNAERAWVKVNVNVTVAAEPAERTVKNAMEWGVLIGKEIIQQESLLV